MSRTLRIVLAASVLAICLSTVGATPSTAATRPLRSGRIVNGVWSPGAVSFIEYGITGPIPHASSLPYPHCSTEPGCAAWLASACSPALAGRDPGLASSIVDVSGLADGSTTRIFSAASSFRWGMLRIELWDRDCQSISGGGMCYSSNGSCAARTLRLAKGTAWMTIVSTGDNADTTWTLR